MVLADAIIPSAVRRLIIGLHSFFLWDFQALDCQRQARIVLVRCYSGDHPHHYGGYVSAVMESMARRIAGCTGMSRKGMIG
jgi:hypothetical protein